MKSPKVSVIVPVYNVSLYIEKCLDSLFNQTYNNLEIIIVDDCSTDDSAKKVKSLIKNKSNVKFYQNKTNSGLSYTRNFAFSKTSGEYISYIDSDDYVPNNYYEELVNKAIKENASVVICDINLVDTDKGTSRREYCGGNTNYEFVSKSLAASACNKLFERKNIENNKFSEGKINEDIAVVIPILVNSKKISYTDKTYYNYIQRNTSIQNSEFSQKRFDIFYAVKLTLERISNNKIFNKYKENLVFNQIILLLIYVIPKEKSILRRYKWLKKYHKLSKEYDILNNIFLKEFLNNQSKKNKYYYKLILFLNCSGFNFLCSLVMQFASIYSSTKKSVIKKDISLDDLIKCSLKQHALKNEKISISVVIPNYNYERFLYQRLYSVLSQTYKIKEIIILDDLSTDNSREKIDEILSVLQKYIKIKVVYNSVNSGSAFKQWEKGFDLASGDYVWIAEADDYCNSKLLSNLINPILNNDNIIISYANTAFINTQGNVIVKSIIPEIDIMKTGHWNSSYVNDGDSEYKNYSFLNCTIANVSSCIIKNENYKKEFQMSREYKQAGDWLFYVNIMQKGKIAYTNKVLNYYRVHGDNVSSTMKKEAHLKEINKIHSYYRKEYGLDSFQEKEIIKRYNFLKKVWKLDK